MIVVSVSCCGRVAVSLIESLITSEKIERGNNTRTVRLHGEFGQKPKALTIRLGVIVAPRAVNDRRAVVEELTKIMSFPTDL